MKKRIVALILTVVMALLALTSCGSFDFAKEDLSAHVDFNLDKFLDDLQNIKISDHYFTGDDATRDKIVATSIYNAVANKLISKATDSDKFKTGAITAGDAVYFVYYAVDEKTGNTFFVSDMDEATVTSAATSENHVVKLGDFFYTNTSSTKDDEDFLQLIIDNAKLGNIEDYIYNTLTKSEIENKALEGLKDDATTEEKDAAKKAALTVKEGDTICVSYTYKYTTEEGAEHTRVASYEIITLDAEDPFHQLFLAEGTTAQVGSSLSNEGNKFEAVINGENRTYTSISIAYKVETWNKNNPIATFKYTPYKTDKQITPSNAYAQDEKVNLKDVELTYYVYPVYAINLPAHSEITAEQILLNVRGKDLKASNYEILSDNEFKNGNETIGDLLQDITLIYNPKAENNDFYKEGTTLQKLNKEYNDAVTAGGTSPNAEQKATIAQKQTALNNEQDAELAKVMKKIAEAKKGDQKIDSIILEQHEENIRHGLEEAYNTHITTEVNKAVLNLIYSSVTVKSYPEKLLKEYRDNLYESYEYDFYKGNLGTDKTITNYDYYNGDFNLYLQKTLKISDMSKLDETLEAEAKKYLEPIIKIHVVAKAVAPKAADAVKNYRQKDIATGKYDEEKIEDFNRLSGMFIVDKAYMRQYKKNVGSAVYRSQIDTYGEINVRTAEQFELLFYYLTSTDFTYNAETGHEHPVLKNGKIAYRTIKYDFK